MPNAAPIPAEPATARRPPPWIVAVAIVMLLVVVAAALVWFSRPPAPPPASATVAAGALPGGLAPATGIFIEPGDGRAPILEEIEAARESIDLQVYIVTDEAILSALEEARSRGVVVRVILEEHPFGGDGGQPAIFARLEQAGIAVRWGNPTFRFTHIKTMVVDNAVAVIMNQNLTSSAFTANREFGIVTTRPDAVLAAEAIFEADWQRGAEPDPGPLVVSPSNARDELLSLIDSASETLELYAEVVRDPEMLAALMTAEERGVAVRLMLSPSNDFDAELEALAAAGVDVRLLSSLYVHAKMILADGERAFVGSQNLSATSLDLNRELGIIVDDPVSLARLSRTFEIDFRAARPLEAP